MYMYMSVSLSIYIYIHVCTYSLAYACFSCYSPSESISLYLSTSLSLSFLTLFVALSLCPFLSPPSLSLSISCILFDSISLSLHLSLCTYCVCMRMHMCVMHPPFARAHTHYTDSSYHKKLVAFWLFQQFLKSAFCNVYDMNPMSYDLLGILDPNVLSNNSSTYELTVCTVIPIYILSPSCAVFTCTLVLWRVIMLRNPRFSQRSS